MLFDGSDEVWNGLLFGLLLLFVFMLCLVQMVCSVQVSYSYIWQWCGLVLGSCLGVWQQDNDIGNGFGVYCDCGVYLNLIVVWLWWIENGSLQQCVVLDMWWLVYGEMDYCLGLLQLLCQKYDGVVCELSGELSGCIEDCYNVLVSVCFDNVMGQIGVVVLYYW